MWAQALTLGLQGKVELDPATVLIQGRPPPVLIADGKSQNGTTAVWTDLST